MTNAPTICCGAVLSTALLPGAESVAQIGATLIGTGLLTWIAIMQARELTKLREENRQLNRELGSNCKTCILAKQANAMLTEAAADYMDSDKN